MSSKEYNRMKYSKILIVEDEFIVATDLKHQLEKMGHDVVGIEGDGEGAIRKAVETEPDLILIDINLKGDLDGIDTAQQLKDIYEVPFIYLSGNSDTTTLERAKITEPSGYIIKPFINKGIEEALQMF
jgi:CheY-like chemotaxis protein